MLLVNRVISVILVIRIFRSLDTRYLKSGLLGLWKTISSKYQEGRITVGYIVISYGVEVGAEVSGRKRVLIEAFPFVRKNGSILYKVSRPRNADATPVLQSSSKRQHLRVKKVFFRRRQKKNIYNIYNTIGDSTQGRKSKSFSSRSTEYKKKSERIYFQGCRFTSCDLPSLFFYLSVSPSFLMHAN